MILVVEDEPGIRDFVERGLRRLDFEVTVAEDGLRGLELARMSDVELVVLDLMLPELSGEEVLRHLHLERPDLPVIVLTARGEVEDRVAGLDAGAIDYMVKPFSLAELAARVRAHLRVSSVSEVTLVRDRVTVDLIGRRVDVRDQEVHFSTKEYELFLYLLRHQGELLSRDAILRAVWGYDHDPQTNILDIYIGYLRRKLTAAGAPNTISTIRSLGFRFEGVTS